MLNVDDIHKIFPIDPFLLVDRIEELEPGLRAVGRKCVTIDEPFLLDIFREGSMPGVLILEALAQARCSGHTLEEQR